MPLIEITATTAQTETRTIIIATEQISSVVNTSATGPNGGVMFHFITINMVGGVAFEFKYSDHSTAVNKYLLLRKSLGEGTGCQL